MTLPPPIKDERVAPYNPFPNNDISALDEGRFDYPSTQAPRVHDRAGNAVNESEEDEARAGGRKILACLDFHREDHLSVGVFSFKATRLRLEACHRIILYTVELI